VIISYCRSHIILSKPLKTARNSTTENEVDKLIIVSSVLICIYSAKGIQLFYIIYL